MAKTSITNSEGMKTPFLRGILTSSLLNAGVEFNLAYETASKIRHQISEKQEITTSELRSIIINHLEDNVEKEVIERFLSATHTSSTIMITCDKRNPEPFSRGQHRLCMESCGLSNDDATSITSTIYNELLNRGYSELSSNELG
ncbi:MAG: hypothetical protein KAI17_17330, partial [Thiotrichaceae bacterium]|nr:hypothetical protein [Thiotrichaceae bacterium]